MPYKPRLRNCEKCGTTFSTRERVQRFCSLKCAKARPKATLPCGWCGAMFERGNNVRTKFCSRNCSNASKVRRSSIVPWDECTVCLTRYVNRSGRKTCTDTCAVERKRATDRERAQPVKITRAVYFPRCPDCGRLFTARAANAVRCAGCRARHAWRRRDAQEKVSKLLPYIGQRDKWQCGICRKPVLTRVYDRSDLMTPTVDHVIPSADGGSDDPSNLRLAHMICNSRRQHFGGGEQLALVG